VQSAAKPREPPGPHRLREASDVEQAGIAAIEPLRERLPNAIRDQDFARARGIREPRGEVHRLPRDSVLAMAGAAAAARHDLTTGDAYMHPKLMAGLCRNVRHRLADGEGGANTPFCVITVRDRCAEHRHHAVADMLVDAATVLDDEVIHAGEKVFEQGVHFLGVERLAQPRVADEVGEQHCHLAPLGFGGDRPLNINLGRGGAQSGDRVKQLAAMPDRRDT
jgi:hypothetical protein